ncbi:hypothetical protein KOR34_15770 [Posidoniimonas corsicana]|uniref:Uncharacterized protein n=1 Tax=Posidoniimonas corsicana TaxID=1938618 RepID=A0A5C5VDG1_9BACT|nr:hypothetical protein [Posidoniimonas corsicana]TWT36638.1 hypothetical protein KOR34_15770 [Posidoniimonas corsicana]
MIGWLRRWAERMIEREIARRIEETRRLKEQIERETGEPIRLSEEERAKLERLAEGMDRETLDRISAYGPEATLSRGTSETNSSE